MLDSNSTISLITLTISDINATKRDCQSGIKHKIQLYTVQKKSTLNIKTHRKKQADEERYADTDQKRTRVAIAQQGNLGGIKEVIT